jgi:hypothetical protein
MHRATVSVAASALLACGCADQSDELPGSFPELAEIARANSVILEEPVEHPLGDVGYLVELGDGFALSDALGPELRTYGADGRLLARYEAFGEGPFEFIRIGGLAVAPEGQLVAVDQRQGRVTLFEPDLDPDTVISPTRPPRGLTRRFGDGFVAATSGGARQTRLSKLSAEWVEEWSVPGPSPGSISEYPYWGSLARTLVAAGEGRLLMAYSFLYALTIVDASGAVADTVVIDAPGFRQARVPEPGEFSGVVGQEALGRWLDSFDVISRIDVVADSLLVVTRGRIRSESAGQFIAEDTSLDVLRLRDLTPLWWDVALPERARVVGAGDRLHVVTASAPFPLELTSYEFIGSGR